MPKIELEISDDLLLALNEDEKEFEKTIKLYTALQLYREHKLTLGQAAELADLNKDEFMMLCGRHGIPVINYDSNDLESETGSF